MKIKDNEGIEIRNHIILLTIENLQSSVPNLVAISSLASTSSQVQKTWSLSMIPLLETSLEIEFTIDSSDSMEFSSVACTSKEILDPDLLDSLENPNDSSFELLASRKHKIQINNKAIVFIVVQQVQQWLIGIMYQSCQKKEHFLTATMLMISRNLST